MEKILLIYNKEFFDNHNIISVDSIDNIPDFDSILFIGSHNSSVNDLDYINEYLDIISKKPYKYIILIGKSDGMLNKNINIPNNIMYIYANNINFDHNKIKFLPMGCDFRSISSFSKANLYNNDKILCYCNFSLNTHPVRKEIYEIIKNKSFIKFENMQTFLNYSISRDEFFSQLGKSKFVICPRGNAIDTFRFYDTLYSGAIPIVVREHFHKLHFFENKPILYLENVNEFKNLTEEFLNKKYDELIKYKENNYLSLDFNIFINNLKQQLKII